MDLSAWVWYTLMAALVMAASLVHYRWRESEGTGRGALALLRGAALAGVVLLLFNPVLSVDDEHRSVVALVDASLSMSLRGDGGARWDRAVEAVREAGPDRIQLFGGEEVRSAADLADAAPTVAGSRLAPALRVALETGAGRIVVVTDGAVDDRAEVRRIAAGAGVPIEVRGVGEETWANVALESVDAPSWLEAGEEAVVRVVVARVGVGGAELPDSGRVTVSRGDRELAAVPIAIPPTGRTVSTELRFRPEGPTDGPVRLDVRVDPGGAVPDDDVRSLYVRITEDPAGVTLVSLRPDQEPRFLLPALERALGLPVRGWLRVGEDRFLRLGAGAEGGVPAGAAAVRRSVAGSSLLVLHGVDENAPAWVRGALARADRVLVLPSGPMAELPVALRPARDGDWYLTADVPSSPVAPLLAGVATELPPPLTRLRPTALPDGYWAPLTARLGRRGDAFPVAMAGTDGGRRVAVALGEGYWRWAFAGSEERGVYERLWAATAGWLMEVAEGPDREAIRPVDRVVGRASSVHWIAPAGSDSVAITIRHDPAEAGTSGDPDGAPLADTTVVVVEGRAVTGALAPGHYRYDARTSDGDGAEGAFTVETYSPELAAAPVALELATDGEGGRVSTGDGRPLRATPWPYMLIVGLLCVEWALRRRWGLR